MRRGASESVSATLHPHPTCLFSLAAITFSCDLKALDALRSKAHVACLLSLATLAIIARAKAVADLSQRGERLDFCATLPSQQSSESESRGGFFGKTICAQ
jgi:hypothetical protein